MTTIKEMLFFMDGKEIPSEAILNWEKKRLLITMKTLKKIKCLSPSPFTQNEEEQGDLEFMRKEVLRLKTEAGLEQLRNALKWRYTLGNIGSVVATTLSLGKRKICSTEILVQTTSLSPEEVMKKITDIMMINTTDHLAINLSSNPDHYVLQALSENVQEVLEITGGSPLPTRFFAHYGEEDGLTSTLTPGYTVQSPGSARLKNGFIIGGVRHQVKSEGNGIRFKAVVEFPALLPQSMIVDHQYHLGCEFGHWIEQALALSEADETHDARY